MKHPFPHAGMPAWQFQKLMRTVRELPVLFVAILHNTVVVASKIGVPFIATLRSDQLEGRP